MAKFETHDKHTPIWIFLKRNATNGYLLSDLSSASHKVRWKWNPSPNVNTHEH